MSSLLLKNAPLLVTMDEHRRELRDAGLFAVDGVIQAVGQSDALPETADTVLDLRHHVVIPGLVNTHHHLYQTLTRAVPAAQDAPLFDWLQALYPIWSRIDAKGIHLSTQVGVAELLLSGCTTTSDHLYLFPNGARLDDEIEAALQTGIRFHACRGSMSLGESDGGLPPDALVEDEATILKDTQRVIETHHDARRFAMLRVDVAPCSPFSVSRDLMNESAKLARALGVRMHSHLAENAQDIVFSEQAFGMRPGEYAESVEWLGTDVWHAHCVHLSDAEISLFGQTGTSIAHCPTSNMRLASGALPLQRCLSNAVTVGLGVDGSASNDGSDLLAEARQAMLLQRVTSGADALSAREVLELATLGGARALGRDDIGALAAGMAADFAAFDLNSLEFAGARHDPLAALVFCQSPGADYTVVQGRVLIEGRQPVTLDLPPLVEQHNRYARSLVNG
ncbi:MAG: 8-oxoguanine deaminase [Gammaproteobacteria bacterium]|nr:8-oxoguanine deaminase [Gammaproteobacteria bacterium]